MSVVPTEKSGNEKRPPYQGRLYYAIQSCEFLRGPAIFFEHEDCSVYLESRKKNSQGEEEPCSFKVCRSLDEAVKFVQPSATLQAVNSQRQPAVAAAATTALKNPPSQAGTSAASHSPTHQKASAVPVMAAANKQQASAVPVAVPVKPSPPAAIPRPSPASIGKLPPATKKKRPQTPGKRQIARDQKFEEMVVLLKEYKEIHGTTDIPRKHASIVGNKFEPLGTWIILMRKQLRLAADPGDNSCYLSAEQVQTLKDNDFCMNPKRGWDERENHRGLPTFDEMFKELQEFKEKNGHCNVPDKPRSLLRNWIVRLRDAYARMKSKGVVSPVLTLDRMTQLASLGFDLNVRPRRPFEERAYEWLEYRTKHGHEPKRETEAECIAVWASKVRAKYERKQAGKKTNLTDEQIKLLDKFGFRWATDAKYRPKRNANGELLKAESKSWDERVKELIEYKKRNGDCLVPQSYPGLGPWVKRQRKEWQFLHQKTKKSRITQEKVDKLASVGFVFEVRKRNRDSKGLSFIVDVDDHGSSKKKRKTEESDSSSDEEGKDEDNQFYPDAAMQNYVASLANRNRYNNYY